MEGLVLTRQELFVAQADLNAITHTLLKELSELKSTMSTLEGCLRGSTAASLGNLAAHLYVLQKKLAQKQADTSRTLFHLLKQLEEADP